LFDGLVIIRIGIRGRRIASRKRLSESLIKRGFADLSFLLGRVLMPVRLIWCHGSPSGRLYRLLSAESGQQGAGSGQQEAGSGALEAGSGKLEAGSWKREAGSAK
jgi:hypothetical protein